MAQRFSTIIIIAMYQEITKSEVNFDERRRMKLKFHSIKSYGLTSPLGANSGSRQLEEPYFER